MPALLDKFWIFGPSSSLKRKAIAERPEPDWASIHAEPNGYQYSRFRERYGRWLARVSVTTRQEHRAGEKGFVDFSGDGKTWPRGWGATCAPSSTSEGFRS